MAVRVAVVGVRGVVKFHAQWFAREGCEVVAFVASRPETLPQNEAALKALVPHFSGRGYTELRQMLVSERPDAVSVCSPHALHAAHALEALTNGAHVLCEKPLVWLGTERLEEALAQTSALVEAATNLGKVLAVNTQYVAAIPALRQLWRERSLPEVPERLTLVMEAKVRERDTSGVDLWVDLAPHPLSLLLALFPDAQLEPDSVVFEEGSDWLTAHFQVHLRPASLRTTISVRRHSGPLERSIAWDDFKVRFEPFVGEDGVYRICLCWDNERALVDDFMQVSIRRFVGALTGVDQPLCDASMAARQMEWLVALVREYLAMKRR